MNLEKFLTPLISVLISLIPEDIIKSTMTDFLNSLETKVKSSKTMIDDITVLPIITLIRQNLSLKSLPGDYNNRVAWYQKYAKQNNVSLTELDVTELEKIITRAGIWQNGVQHYINSLLNQG